MAKGQNAAKQVGVDLWKPGPLCSWAKNAVNKRLERRIKRHQQKQKDKRLVGNGES